MAAEVYANHKEYSVDLPVHAPRAAAMSASLRSPAKAIFVDRVKLLNNT